MPSTQKIVLVDDEKTTTKLASNALASYDLVVFNDPRKALQHCLTKPFDILICDQKMPGITGLELIQEVRKQKDDFLALVLSAYTDTDIMLQAVNSQLLYHYLVKPVEVGALEEIVRQALEELARRRHEREVRESQASENERLRQENALLRFHTVSPLDAIYGTHPQMLKIKEQIKTYALSDHPVLITGEEGTGKKLCAQVLHQLSARRNGPFVHFDCSNFSEDTLEIELFGLSRSGGKVEREGFLAQAEGGVLYLSQFTQMDKALQAKLLRFLNYGTYYNAGGELERAADVRIILSTNLDVLREVQNGAIRKELFYKIGTLHIKVPALRDRRSDVVGLIDFIVQRRKIDFPALSAESLDFFTHYLYPGNVRELEGLIEKVHVYARSRKTDTVEFADLEKLIHENVEMYRMTQGQAAVIKTVQLPTGKEQYNMKAFIREIEKELIESSLREHDRNISQTARFLMISRQGLKNKIKRYGLEGYDDEEYESEGTESDDFDDEE